MDKSEIKNEFEKLNKRYQEILDLPKEEFLSDSITKELKFIRIRMLELIKLS